MNAYLRSLSAWLQRVCRTWGMRVRAVGVAVLSVGLGFCLLTGCHAPIAAYCGDRPLGPRPGYGQFAAMPRVRVGCLPFPGLFTLYESADAFHLGDHSYSGITTIGDGEVGRGIIYTCRGGFVDIAHVRNAADLTAYIHARTAHAIRNGWTCMRFRSKEPSIYEVEFQYPDDWWRLDDSRREELAQDLSIRIAQRLAFTVMTWHELITWYGYRSTLLACEKGSAFTVEETCSHLIGVEAAGEALRTGGDYNAELTKALERIIQKLRPVDHGGLRAALSAVDGNWHQFGEPVKRYIHEATEGETFRPWLAPGLEFADGLEPAEFRLPGLADVQGIDCSRFYSVAIRPRVLEAFTMRKRAGCPEKRIRPARDFPPLFADIRASLGPERLAP